MNFQTLAKPNYRWILILIAIATAVSGAIALYGIAQLRQPSQPPAPAEAKADVVEQVTALGRLEPATEVIQVSVPATLGNDRVAELQVEQGDRVEVGQVIAVLESRDRLQNAVLEAEAQVGVAQAELARVQAGAKVGEIAAQEAEIMRLQRELTGDIATQQATIARRQAELKTAEAEYNRYRSLYQSGAISASELAQRQLTLDTSQAQLNEARATQSRSQASLQEQIKQAQATLAQIAEVRPVDVQAAQAEVERAIAAVKRAEADLAEVYIRAPIAGRILNIYTRPGEVVAGNGIVELGETDQMQVVAEVYQTDISKIREGQTALITSESFTGELRGVVRLIGLQVLQQEVTSGEPGENLDRKVIQVKIRLNPADSQRVANLTNLQVQVDLPVETSVLSLP
ncbi:ABC exporter membrane fusion protein [Almyronema epifaneia]|uniref:ABC exporter membrane fusion protein n=1 Tax=Almyronema epifaneia S1 TaxID=2991925 RepID=A0ABW6IEM7_9CYAN